MFRPLSGGQGHGLTWESDSGKLVVNVALPLSGGKGRGVRWGEGGQAVLGLVKL